MITAAEARTNTKKCIDEKIDREIKHIEEIVNNAMMQGKYSITENGTLLNQTVKTLKDLGYEVSRGCFRNEQSYSISWRCSGETN